MKARYVSRCGECGQQVNPGDEIGPVGRSGRYGQKTNYGHAKCSAIWQNRVNEEAGEWFC